MDDTDRRLIVATQSGLPLVEQPYHALAVQLGLSPREVMDRMEHMVRAGVIRRIGAVPNHYALGYLFYGMSVWDVANADFEEAGTRVAALAFVSHCYQRPPILEAGWPYSLFAMIHAKDQATADHLVQTIADVLGPLARGHRVLFSTRILKKTGLRMSA